MLFSLVAIVLAGAISYRQFQTVQAKLRFTNSFALDTKTDWRPFGGSWLVRNGEIENDSDERGAKIVAGSPKWRNYAVDSDVFLLGPGGDAGIIVRSTDEEEGVDSYNGYYAGLRNLDNRLAIGRADHGWMEYQSTPIQGGVQTKHWYHLRVVAFGCDIGALATDLSNGSQAAVSLHDNECTESGRLGLRSYAAGGAWKNVRAAVAKAADLEDIRRLNRNATSAHALETEAGFNKQPTQDLWDSVARHTELPGGGQPDVVSINRLRFKSEDPRTIWTIRGSVVLTSPFLDVEDSTGGAVVVPSSDVGVKVGDDVEISGNVLPLDFGAKLTSAQVRVISTNTPIPPLAITANQAATGLFDARYIDLEGTLTQIIANKNQTVLCLEEGAQSYRAKIFQEQFDRSIGKLETGSRLSIRGVASVDSNLTESKVPFVVLVRSPAEIRVLASPPWWGRKHLVEMGAVLVLLAFLALFVYTRIERWKFQAVLEERVRMAHDLHDTLSQSFAGIGFQLQAILYEIPQNLQPIRQKLDVARDLVRHGHSEARRTIEALRVDSLGQCGLLDELERSAMRMIHPQHVSLRFSQEGTSVVIPPRVVDAFFRIAQEAIANALRHANPTRIDTVLHYDSKLFELVVSDDGIGFDPSVSPRGFGLLGMRERAAAVSVQLEIQSQPGSGTRVKVIAPVPPSIVSIGIKTLLANGRGKEHSHA